jgi:hypothetical protein
MGNPEFNGKKFDYWSNEKYNEFGVWNNEMSAKQFIAEWESIYAPSKEEAINKAKELNSK